METKQRKHTVDILFVITLFAVFAISVIVLTGVGADVYETIVEKMTDDYDMRTSVTYVTNKVRQYDSEGAVFVGEYSGQESLIIKEDIDNVIYCTYLYCYDGMLKEVFTRQGQVFDPSYGTDILKIDDFSITQVTDSLLKFEITPKDQEKETLFIHLRSVD